MLRSTGTSSIVRITVPALLLSLLLAACSSNTTPAPGGGAFTPPASASALNPAVLYTQGDGVKVYNGGFGSAAAKVPGHADEIYLLTDRGPNFAAAAGTGLVFPIPTFSPEIGVFKVSATGLTKLSEIRLKRPDGSPLSGLPNPAGQGATGENAVDLAGAALTTDPYGIDSEGLVALPDGTFWVSDEYGPHLAHFDASGKELERINPFGTGTGGRKLPKVLAKRRVNRGMEGLTLSSDGQWLVGMIQSAMENPDSDARKKCQLTRIVFFNIASGATKQYVYVQDSDSASNCEIANIPTSNTDFIVIERDGNFPGDPATPSTLKRVYRLSITGATDVSDPADGANGKLYGGKTIEELKDAAGLSANGIVPVAKSLVLDLLTKGYTHDKFEGLFVYDATTIVCTNDDDFGVTDAGGGKMGQKKVPGGQVDSNEVDWYKLTTPLY
jgi:hypothetical protein